MGEQNSIHAWRGHLSPINLNGDFWHKCLHSHLQTSPLTLLVMGGAIMTTDMCMCTHFALNNLVAPLVAGAEMWTSYRL